MKRLLWIFLIFAAAGLLLACSGGKADEAAPTPPPTPVTRLSIKTDGFPAITDDSYYTENIVIAVNESYAANYTDWQTRAQNVIDTVNTVLNRSAGNKKQYAIGKFITYPDANFNTMYTDGADSSYYLDNGFEYCVGTTIFIYMYDGAANKPAIFTGNICGLRVGRTSSDGRIQEEAWIAYDVSSSPFTNFSLGDVGYETSTSNILHELGHTMGLAKDEWYNYYFTDSSGVAPDLGLYNRMNQYPHDPMVGASIPLAFSDINSFALNKNAEHTYTCSEIIQGIPDVIKVKVVDSSNNPISGASVKIFAAAWKGATITSPVLLLDTTTDVNGEAVINSDDASTSTYGSLTYAHKFSVYVPAKIIKVESSGKVAGAYLTLTDLEKAFLQDGLNTLTVELVPE